MVTKSKVFFFTTTQIPYSVALVYLTRQLLNEMNYIELNFIISEPDLDKVP